MLGWIFIFPLPLTILMLRKKKLNPIVKFGVIILAWAFYFAIALTSDTAEETPVDPDLDSYSSVVITENSSNAETAEQPS